MFPHQVTLLVTEENLPTWEHHFDGPARCLIGRSEDCDLRLGRGAGAGEVSRHHCRLAIDPPRIRVRDLGSLNGTFVNGECIGRRLPEQSAEEVPEFPWRDLEPGDVVRAGHCWMRIGVALEEDGPEQRPVFHDTYLGL